MAQFGGGLMDRQRLTLADNAYHTFVTVPRAAARARLPLRLRAALVLRAAAVDRRRRRRRHPASCRGPALPRRHPAAARARQRPADGVDVPRAGRARARVTLLVRPDTARRRRAIRSPSTASTPIDGFAIARVPVAGPAPLRRAHYLAAAVRHSLSPPRPTSSSRATSASRRCWRGCRGPGVRRWSTSRTATRRRSRR